MTIGERLEALIEQQGTSIADVARATEMERQTVWRIVTGQTPNPGILTIKKIVEAAGGTIFDLFPEEAKR
ncbi:MAG TPA: helix-turn-helix transcriptional regulator [Isosphaeraceae bacterium]